MEKNTAQQNFQTPPQIPQTTAFGINQSPENINPIPPPVLLKKKFPVGLIIGIVLFLILAGGAAAGFVFKDQLLSLVSNPTPTPAPVAKKQTPSPTPNPTANPNSIGANWKVFTQKISGFPLFTFKYPPNYRQLPIGEEFFGGIKNDNDSSEILIKSLTLNYSKELFKNTYQGEIILSEGKLESGQSYLIAKSTESDNPNFVWIQTENDSSTLELNLNRINLNTLNQILSSFKFTDQTQTIDTSTWKTYSNAKYAISLKYPPSLYTSSSSTDSYFFLTAENCENGEAFCGVRDSFGIKMITTTEKTLDEWISKNLLTKSTIEGEWIDQGIECYKQAYKQTLIVDKLTSISYSFSQNQMGHPYLCRVNVNFDEKDKNGIIQHVYLLRNGVIYDFDLRSVKSSALDASLKQILSTVKFTD